MNKIDSKTINRLLCFSLLVFSISLIFVVFKYIGLVNLIGKILRSLTPVFIAIFISFILEPIIGLFLNKGVSRKISVLITYGLLILVICVILGFTIPSLFDQFNVFINNIPNLLDIVTNFASKLGFVLEQDRLSNWFNSFFMNASKGVFGYLFSSFSTLFNIILGISGAVFLSFDFPMFRNGVKKYIPKRIKKPVEYYFQTFLPFVHKYFLGMLIDSALIFVLSIICFSIISIDYTLVISLFIAITNLIPIIGPYIGGIPAVIIGFGISPTLGVSAIVAVVIVQIIESNFVQPLILKNIIKLHPLEGILGISLFGVLFGIAGMILSPILVIAIKLLFTPYNEKENISVKQVENVFDSNFFV